MPPTTSPSASPTVGLTSFVVVIDGVQLPSFSECQGLAAEVAVEPWAEGGQNGFTHQLPGRISYSPITLTRYIDRASAGLAAWFSTVVDPTEPYRTGTVSATDAAGTPFASWSLTDVFPSRYTGPSFSSGGATAATESLELIHHGFAFTWTGS